MTLLSSQLIGRALPVVRARVEAGRLRSFRRTIGSSAPDDPSAPATYLFALEMLESDRPLAFVEALGVDMARVLHSEQAFSYHSPVRAGDEIRLETVIADVFEKKGGALTFVVQDTTATNQDGVHVADIRRTLVVRQ